MTERRKRLHVMAIACIVGLSLTACGGEAKQPRDEDSFRYGQNVGSGVAQSYLTEGRFTDVRTACQEALKSGRESGAVEEVVENDFLDGCVEGVDTKQQ